MVDSKSYVLQCLRYIDLNPAHARMADDPRAYPWSSCAAHCGQREDALLTSPGLHRSCLHGAGRTKAYHRLPQEALADDGPTVIRAYLQQQRTLRSRRFLRHGRGQNTTLRRCAGGASASARRRRKQEVNLTPSFVRRRSSTRLNEIIDQLRQPSSQLLDQLDVPT